MNPRQAWRRFAQRLPASLGAFEDVVRNRDLRRLQLAWVGSVIGTWAFGVALAVYAYRVDGVAGVGLVGLLRTLPSALGGPFTAALGDRYPRVRVMIVSDLLRALLFAAAALAIVTDGPALLVYVLAGLVMLAGTAFRPAQGALLPQLTKTPEELTASNVISTTVESVGFFAGPALGGLLLVVTSPEVVLLVSGGTCLWSAAMLIGIRTDEDRGVAVAPPAGFLRHAMGGFVLARRDRDLLLLLALFMAQTLVAGALNVLVVVLSIEMLLTGEPGVGYLNAAVGLGGVLGAFAAASLVRGRRLAAGFLTGMVLWGAPLVVIGLAPSEPTGYVMLGLVGLGNTIVDVAGFTLLQRSVPDEVMARVFGVLETILMASVGLGALVTPLVIDVLGREGSFIVIGAFLPLLTAAAWRRLRTMDARTDPPEEALKLLQGHAIFRPLALVTQEQLAETLEERRVEPGDVVIREGDPGADFYLVAQGRFDVSSAGEHRYALRPGECFGEIALLRDTPRTATVTAGPDGGRVYALGRPDFLRAVAGTRTGAAAAEELADARAPLPTAVRRMI